MQLANIKLDQRGKAVLTRAVIFFFVVFLSGCTTLDPIPLSSDASRQLQDKSVVRTTYPAPNFFANNHRNSMFGLIGAVAAFLEGNSMIQENDVQDPAIAIGQGIVDRLIATRNATQVPSLAVTTSDDIQTLLATYQGADILVDVKTVDWMYSYYPAKWGRYKVTHLARVRLIDSASKEVMVVTGCASEQSDDANPPTEDQLLQNKAALLKEYLSKSATSCIDRVTKDFLLIDTPIR